MSNPAQPTVGLGELVRSHRLYVGLSRDAMAAKIGMNPSSYERIENGTNSCPAGFIDTMEQISEMFDKEVEDVIAKAANMLGARGMDADDVVRTDVDPHTMGVWDRSVLGRASIESGLIMPILVGIDKPHRKAG